MSDILDRDELRREVALAGHAASEARRELAAVTIERHDAAQRAEIERLTRRAEALTKALARSEVDVALARSWCRLCRTEGRGDYRGRVEHPHAPDCVLFARAAAKSASCPHTLTLASGQVLHCIYVEGHDDIPHGYHREE